MSTIALEKDWSEHFQKEERENLFNQLIVNYSQDMHRYAYWLAGDRHTAEDLVQEAMLRAWRAIDSLKDPHAAKGWLLTILRRENARRFERKQLTCCDIPLETLTAKKSTYDTSTEAFVLRRAMEALPEEYRDPLVKKVIGGYSQKEIAETMGISSAGVGTRLFRARNKLKAVLAA